MKAEVKVGDVLHWGHNDEAVEVSAVEFVEPDQQTMVELVGFAGLFGLSCFAETARGSE